MGHQRMEESPDERIEIVIVPRLYDDKGQESEEKSKSRSSWQWKKSKALLFGFMIACIAAVCIIGGHQVANSHFTDFGKVNQANYEHNQGGDGRELTMMPKPIAADNLMELF